MVRIGRKTLRRAKAGFSLLEVLVAMAIFALGFILVASILPVSAMLQKRSAELVRSQQAARNAQSMLNGRALLESELTDATYGLPSYSADYDSDRRVYPLPNVSGSEFLPHIGHAGPPSNWSLSDRSFPTTIPDAVYRDLYWVPLVRDSDPNSGAGNRNFEVYVFILQRSANDIYPKPALTGTDRWANPNDPEGTYGPPFEPGVPGVRSVGVSVSGLNRFAFDTAGFNVDNDIQSGDLVLDNFGYIYRVVGEPDDDGFEVSSYIFPNPQTGEEPDTIWYGKPASNGKPSPTLDVLVLTEIVK